MSEIDVTWLEDGNWIRYDDHVAAVERVIAERNAARAEVERLKELLDQESKSLPKLIDSMTSQLRATADRVTAERDEAQRERDRVQDLLTFAGRELSTLREALRVRRRDQSDQRDKALARVKRLTHKNMERLKNALDHRTSERDEARAEVERLTARQTEMETHITGLTAELHRTRADGIELRWVEGEVEQLTAQRDAAQAEVERLRANGQALLDRSRPSDEDIWREAFMSQLHNRYGAASELAEVALAGYRKRWPR